MVKVLKRDDGQKRGKGLIERGFDSKSSTWSCMKSAGHGDGAGTFRLLLLSQRREPEDVVADLERSRRVQKN